MSISTEHSLGNKKRKKSTFKHKKLKTQTAIARGTNVKKIQIHLTKVYSDTEAKKLLYLFIFIWVLWPKLKWRLAKNVLFPYCENKS